MLRLSLCFYMEEFYMEELNPPNSLKSRYTTKLEDFIIRIENNNVMVDNLYNRDMLCKLIKLKMEKLIIDHC